MIDDVTPALATLREFLAHTELPRGSTWASLRADLSFIVQAVADARRQALEDAAQLCEDHGHSNGRIRGSHKHLAAAIRALLPKAASRGA